MQEVCYGESCLLPSHDLKVDDSNGIVHPFVTYDSNGKSEQTKSWDCKVCGSRARGDRLGRTPHACQRSNQETMSLKDLMN